MRCSEPPRWAVGRLLEIPDPSFQPISLSATVAELGRQAFSNHAMRRHRFKLAVIATAAGIAIGLVLLSQ
jgi:hypothetical protein